MNYIRLEWYNAWTNDIFAVFGGDRCEDDLVDSCEANTCSEHGMCQNLVSQNKATCLCPTTGVYTGDRYDNLNVFILLFQD